MCKFAEFNAFVEAGTSPKLRKLSIISTIQCKSTYIHICMYTYVYYNLPISNFHTTSKQTCINILFKKKFLLCFFLLENIK